MEVRNVRHDNIVSTSRESLEKFMLVRDRTAHMLRICVKILTITFGSILQMKIRRIKTDSNDMTLSIPSAILPGLNENSKLR